MGEPDWSYVQLPLFEHIKQMEDTWGRETSQYPQEEKTNSDSVSSGERKRMSLNQNCVIANRRCSFGVVGLDSRIC